MRRSISERTKSPLVERESRQEWRQQVIYKRGKVYWYEFWFKGKRIQKSTMQGNAVKARDAASAARTRLVNGVNGIERQEPKIVPTLEEFKTTFMEWVRSEKSNVGTQIFYETCFDRLIEFSPMSKLTLSEIDEPIIERFKLWASEKTSQATVNRYLATLRKALRYAWRKLRLFDRMPIIELYPNERQREFVFSDKQYQLWTNTALEPLRAASVLAHDGGICRGEMLALQRDCIHLADTVDARGFWGMIEIKRGLKRLARKRTIPITEAAAFVLRKLMAESKCEYVFTSLRDHSQPLSANTLANQHRIMMKSCSFPPDAGLHALRHTFLTEAGRHTQNVRALQKLAGHSRIETTMRYIHPDQDDVMDIAGAVESARVQRNLPDTTGVPTNLPTVARGDVVVASKLQ
jgi:integrase